MSEEGRFFFNQKGEKSGPPTFLPFPSPHRKRLNQEEGREEETLFPEPKRGKILSSWRRSEGRLPLSLPPSILRREEGGEEAGSNAGTFSFFFSSRWGEKKGRREVFFQYNSKGEKYVGFHSFFLLSLPLSPELNGEQHISPFFFISYFPPFFPFSHTLSRGGIRKEGLIPLFFSKNRHGSRLFS